MKIITTITLALSLTACAIVIPATSTRPHDARPREYRVAEKRAAAEAKTQVVRPAAIPPCSAPSVRTTGGVWIHPCVMTTPDGRIVGEIFTLTNRDLTWWDRLRIRIAIRMDPQRNVGLEKLLADGGR